MHDKVGRLLKTVHRDAGLVVLEFEEGPPICYQSGGEHGTSFQVPLDELSNWTHVELGFMSKEEYRAIADAAQRERHIQHHLKAENEDYFKMWQLYHKYGGTMPTKFPTEVLTVARACQWDSPEHVDITLKGVIFRVTKKDME